MGSTKTCSRCKQVKPTTEFAKSANRADGLQYWCRACERALKKAKYYKDVEKTKQRRREEQRKYRLRNVEKYRQRDKKYYRKKHAEKLAKAKDYRVRNKSLINKKQILANRLQGISPKSGYVYVARFPYALDGKICYKIGQSSDPKGRMEKISSHSPVPVILEILIETPDVSLLESELHHYFSSKRSNKEWFFLETEDIAYIKSNYPCLLPPFTVLLRDCSTTRMSTVVHP